MIRGLACTIQCVLFGLMVWSPFVSADLVTHAIATPAQKQAFIDELNSVLLGVIEPIASDAYVHIELDARMAHHWLKADHSTKPTTTPINSNQRLLSIERELTYLDKALSEVNDEVFKANLLQSIEKLYVEKSELSQQLKWQSKHVKTQSKLEVLRKQITITLNETVEPDRLTMLRERLEATLELNEQAGDQLEIVQRHLPSGTLLDQGSDSETDLATLSNIDLEVTSEFKSAQEAGASQHPTIGIPVFSLEGTLFIVILVLLAAIAFVIYGIRKPATAERSNQRLEPNFGIDVVKPTMPKSKGTTEIKPSADLQTKASPSTEVNTDRAFQYLEVLTGDALFQLLQNESTFMKSMVLTNASEALSFRLLEQMTEDELFSVMETALRLPQQAAMDLMHSSEALKFHLESLENLPSTADQIDKVLKKLLLLNPERRSQMFLQLQSSPSLLSDRLFDLLNFYGSWVDAPILTFEKFEKQLTSDEKSYLLQCMPESVRSQFQSMIQTVPTVVSSELLNLSQIYDKLSLSKLSMDDESEWRIEPDIKGVDDIGVSDLKNSPTQALKSMPVADASLIDGEAVKFNSVAPSGKSEMNMEQTKDSVDFLDFSHLQPPLKQKK